MIKLSRKVVFWHCLQLQNAGQHISTTIEFQNFPGDYAVHPPPPPGVPTLCLGVKPSRPPVQNLNETLALEGELKLKGGFNFACTVSSLYTMYLVLAG